MKEKVGLSDKWAEYNEHADAPRSDIATGFIRPTEIAASEIKPLPRWKTRIGECPRILVVTDDDLLAEKLGAILHRGGLIAERAASLTEGCERATSGRFPVVVTTPRLRDGSWQNLIEISRCYRPGFATILLARTFDLGQWARALEAGATEVLDVLYELPRVADVARRALWTEYLTGVWPNLEIPDPPRVS